MVDKQVGSGDTLTTVTIPKADLAQLVKELRLTSLYACYYVLCPHCDDIPRPMSIKLSALSRSATISFISTIYASPYRLRPFQHLIRRLSYIDRSRGIHGLTTCLDDRSHASFSHLHKQV